jgi:hypothetical protein
MTILKNAALQIGLCGLRECPLHLPDEVRKRTIFYFELEQSAC